MANHFDTNGIRVFRDVSGDRTTVWKYRKCSAWGPGGWYAGVGYHNNGKLMVTGQLAGGSYDTAKRNGEWTFYDSLGRLERKEFYNLDTLLKTINY